MKDPDFSDKTWESMTAGNGVITFTEPGKRIVQLAFVLPDCHLRIVLQVVLRTSGRRRALRAWAFDVSAQQCLAGGGLNSLLLPPRLDRLRRIDAREFEGAAERELVLFGVDATRDSARWEEFFRSLPIA